MDDMRNRYRATRRDYSSPVERPPEPAPVHDSLRSAYQPPPDSRQAGRPEPAHHPVEREPLPAPTHRTAKPKSKRKLKRLLTVVILLAVLAGGGLYAYPKYAAPNPFSADIQTNAGYGLFYPRKLPAGYTIDKTKINLTNGVVIYAADNNDKRIVFTLQKVPSTFDFDTFYKQQFSATQRIQTAYGQAVIGKNGDRYLGSLTSGSTWLLLSTNSTNVSIDDMSLVMAHLKQY
jgi:hypothetical protein